MPHEFSKAQTEVEIGTAPLTTVRGYHAPEAADLMKAAIKAGMEESQGGIEGETYDFAASGPYICHVIDDGEFQYVVCEPYHVTTPQAAAGEGSTT